MRQRDFVTHILYICRRKSLSSRHRQRIAQEYHCGYYIRDRNACFIVSYNEKRGRYNFISVRRGKCERRADNSSNNTYRCFNEHDNYFSRNSTHRREREEERRAISTLLPDSVILSVCLMPERFSLA